MATYTIVTSNAEEKALDYALALRNEQRATEIPPKSPLSKVEYVDQIMVRRSLLAFKADMDKAEQKVIADAYGQANNQTQNAVKTALGL